MTAVAITGVGIFVPGYTEIELLFDALYGGKSLLQNINISQSSRSSVNVICSRVDDGQLNTVVDVFPHLKKASVSKSTKMAMFAARQATLQSGFSADNLGDRLGLFVGCNKNLLSLNTLYNLWQKSPKGTDETIRIRAEIDSLNQHQAIQYIAHQLSVKGITQSFSDACTAAPIAMISAQRRILSGELDVAICGATEYATDPIMQMSFSKLGALNNATYDNVAEASCPFDENRAGCILADGAAFVILESVEHANQRGATTLAYLSGASRQTEAYKATSTEASGMYYKKSMDDALVNAGLSVNDIQHISAHGTSTISNDAAEGHAIDQMFYSKQSAACLNKPPTVTSTKSALGHSLAASGAVEAVLCIQSLVKQKVLPTLNYSQPNKGEALLDIVTHGTPQILDHILSNSFGFGGENATLLFSKK